MTATATALGQRLRAARHEQGTTLGRWPRRSDTLRPTFPRWRPAARHPRWRPSRRSGLATGYPWSSCSRIGGRGTTHWCCVPPSVDASSSAMVAWSRSCWFGARPASGWSRCLSLCGRARARRGSTTTPARSSAWSLAVPWSGHSGGSSLRAAEGRHVLSPLETGRSRCSGSSHPLVPRVRLRGGHRGCASKGGRVDEVLDMTHGGDGAPRVGRRPDVGRTRGGAGPPVGDGVPHAGHRADRPRTRSAAQRAEQSLGQHVRDPGRPGSRRPAGPERGRVLGGEVPHRVGVQDPAGASPSTTASRSTRRRSRPPWTATTRRTSPATARWPRASRT